MAANKKYFSEEDVLEMIDESDDSDEDEDLYHEEDYESADGSKNESSSDDEEDAYADMRVRKRKLLTKNRLVSSLDKSLQSENYHPFPEVKNDEIMQSH